jgi:hypothetical protein
MDLIGPVCRKALGDNKLCIIGDSLLDTQQDTGRNQRLHLDDIKLRLIVLVYMTRCKPTRSIALTAQQASMLHRLEYAISCCCCCLLLLLELVLSAFAHTIKQNTSNIV